MISQTINYHLPTPPVDRPIRSKFPKKKASFQLAENNFRSLSRVLVTIPHNKKYKNENCSHFITESQNCTENLKLNELTEDKLTELAESGQLRAIFQNGKKLSFWGGCDD